MNILVIWKFCGKSILFIFVLKHANLICDIRTNSITKEIKSLVIGDLRLSESIHSGQGFSHTEFKTLTNKYRR